MSYWNDFIHRLRESLDWVAAQFWATLILLLAAIAWTRLPDRYGWEVFLSLLLPAVIIAALLFLETSTMRSLWNSPQSRERYVLCALAVLGWALVYWLAWWFLDWCDDRIPLWAGYLNSRASAGERATIFTYEHLALWFAIAEWILRWIVLPGKMIPQVVASAQRGWHLPIRSLIRVTLSWRWWPAVIAAALIAVKLPEYFFSTVPSGTVTHQVLVEILKLVATYVLAIGCWIVLLAWSTVLLDPAQMPPSESALLPEPGNDAVGQP